MKKRIGILGFDGIEALDLLGPLETFAATRNLEACRNASGYEILIVGFDERPFRSESGVLFTPDTTLADAPAFDTVIVPGGRGVRTRPAITNRIADWLRNSCPRTRRIASVCTGVYALAVAGLLDGRRASTHWNYAHDVAKKFPAIKLDANALFVKDGRYYTSAGVTAGIDLALALVEEDYGSQIALGVARYLVVYVKRPGGQDQYSEPLQYQTRSSPRFDDLTSWMLTDLRRDLSVETMAAKACLSARQFRRAFTEAFGTSPAAFVEDLRLNEARQRLTAGSAPIDRIAQAVGYASDDAFRRAFQRRFGVAPLSYRKQFASTSGSSAKPTRSSDHEQKARTGRNGDDGRAFGNDGAASRHRQRRRIAGAREG